MASDHPELIEQVKKLFKESITDTEGFLFGGNVQKISFSPHFWSFNRGALGRSYPGTAGLLCKSDHSLFNEFPTQSFADARWMHLVHQANAFNWGEPIAKGTFANSPELQKVDFGNTYQARFVKFVSVAEVNNRKWAAIADLDFY